jgi:farnesyl-diphosphate farnesyltransferase
VVNGKVLQKEAMQMLKQTSRTFYVPITLLGPTLKKTVGAAYLCMRAIDEIEDHETMDAETKQYLLRETGDLLRKDTFDYAAYEQLVAPHISLLPEVTLRLGDWIRFCPDDIAGKVTDSTGVMAYGMADWTGKNWYIRTKADLDDYTYYVAGLVGVMLSDIWEWYDGTKTDRELAIGYGRGLQAVNMLRNEEEDKERGVQFFPDGWQTADMFRYAEDNLALADEYMKAIKTRNITLFCKIPLALAKKTLKALDEGREKITRTEVEETVEQIKKE